MGSIDDYLQSTDRHQVESDIDMGLMMDYTLSNKTARVPMGTSVLLNGDKLLQLFYIAGMHHRSFIESREFALMARPLAKSLISGEYAGARAFEDDPAYVGMWDRIFEIHAPYEHRFLRSELKMTKEDRVLEVGSSTGNLAVRLAKDAGEVVGIDMSQADVEFAREKARGIGNCRFVAGSYPRDVDGSEFDYVLSFMILPDHLAGGRPRKAQVIARFDMDGLYQDGSDKMYDRKVRSLFKGRDISFKTFRLPEMGKRTGLSYYVIR